MQVSCQSYSLMLIIKQNKISKTLCNVIILNDGVLISDIYY